jgi:alginate O-acetyltransferase complex protein AlgI
MLFNSFEFLIFFPTVVLLYYLFPFSYRWAILLLASCAFYMFFIPVYILILFLTIIIDYSAGICIEKDQRNKKAYLIISIIANIGILVFFKYANFFIQNINFLTKEQIPFLNIILPIGLSFHTFQALSYMIEVYRGNQKAERHLGIYALYVMFFPQLVAGPIERPQNVMHQFKQKHKFKLDLLYSGLRLMLWGFFKKVVVADRLSIYVDAVYNNPHLYTNYLNVILAFFFFSIQIYCDFSGYSDIAIGSARVMGFDLMLNFNRPYFSRNIREFWTRWHISLSTWFRDYLYIPLGGSRNKKSTTYRNILIVFILSGLWHGASWTFIAWGLIHAIFLIINSVFGKYFFSAKTWINTTTSCVFTFFTVTVAWVFFRANNFSDAFYLLKNCFSLNRAVPFETRMINGNTEFGTTSLAISFLVILFTLIIEKRSDPDFSQLEKYKYKDLAFGIVVLFLTITLGVFQKISFIYFQF